jgi:hypothetical protein
MEAIRQAVEHNPISNFIPLTVAILLLFFWVALADLTFLEGPKSTPGIARSQNPTTCQQGDFS